MTAATIALGDCYRYAYHRTSEEGGTLVHGTVEQPFARPSRSYGHAWVEHEGTVYDWQTMEAHGGGNWMGKGYPQEVFYELFKPTEMTRYTSEEALTAAASSTGGRLGGGAHYGPWEESG